MAGPAKKPSKEEVKAMIKFKKEKKKLDELLKKGKISQGAYQRRLQKIAPKGAQLPGMQMAPAGGMAPPMAPMPGGPPQQPMPGQQPVPQVPITPSAHEEIPQVGKPLAISSNDIEVVECHQCGGLITVTAPQRPVIVECPSCGAKGEVEKVEEEEQAAPEPVSATEAEFASPTFYLGTEEEPAKPEFGESLPREEVPEAETEVKSPTVETDEGSDVVVHERPSTVEYDESMYETKDTPVSYEHEDLSTSSIMDFGEAKVEGDEAPEPKVETKTPTPSVAPTPTVEKTPTPTVSSKPKLKPKVKPKVKEE